MGSIIIVSIVILLILALGSSKPHKRIVYVPVEVVEQGTGGLGCLVLLVAGIAGVFLFIVLNTTR